MTVAESVAELQESGESPELIAVIAWLYAEVKALKRRVAELEDAVGVPGQ